MTKKELDAYGRAMFGPRYQPKLAAILGHFRGKPIEQSQISKWVSGPDGQRDPPPWLDQLVIRSAIQMKHERAMQAEVLGQMIDNHYEQRWAERGTHIPEEWKGATDADYVDPESLTKPE